MTPVEKATAIRLAADNLERAFHSALHTLRTMDAPGSEALRLHESTIRAASAAADDVADALIALAGDLDSPNVLGVVGPEYRIEAR